MDIGQVDRRVSRVLDIKTPDSGEMKRNLWSNIDELTSHDQVKFVICSDHDYEWARQQLDEHSLKERCEVLFSPSWQQMNATELADRVLKDQLPVRVQLQLHKILWGDVPGK